MDISFDQKALCLVVNISGEIDHHSSEELRYQIEKECFISNTKNLVLNFKNVSFMDSSGIGMIIGRYKYVSDLGGRLAIACINENLKRIFMLSGLNRIIQNYNSVEEAVKSI